MKHKREKRFNPIGKTDPKPKPRAPERHRSENQLRKLTTSEILSLARPRLSKKARSTLDAARLIGGV